jgi:hypothetical protein
MILQYLLSDYKRAQQEAVSFRSLRKHLHFKSSFGVISLAEDLLYLPSATTVLAMYGKNT